MPFSSLSIPNHEVEQWLRDIDAVSRVYLGSCVECPQPPREPGEEVYGSIVSAMERSNTAGHQIESFDQVPKLLVD